jgi:glycosyltransferase involved in cell wall biosynthesis
LEAPYTRPSAAWRRLIAAHDRHIAVGGTPLIANLLAGSGRPHLLWCAAQVDDDRGARVAAMSWPRRLFDRLVVRPGLLAQQRRVLGSADCTVTGVSRYTCRVLAGIGAARPRWLPIPTDLQRFSPPDRPAPVGVVGFAARLGDPRKRVPLLLEAMARLGASARLRLAGEVPDELPPLAARLGLSDRVEFLDHIPESALPDFYRSLDVFALPSSQEGLGIVGVEAMACGVPVVAAARGFGPDDYIVEGVTGRFTAADPAALAEGLGAIIADRPGRNAMAAAARRRAEEMYGHDAFARGLAEAWYETWGDAP